MLKIEIMWQNREGKIQLNDRKGLMNKLMETTLEHMKGETDGCILIKNTKE